MTNISLTGDFTQNLTALTQDFGAANAQVAYSATIDMSSQIVSQSLSVGGENMTFGQVAPAGQTAQNDAQFSVPSVA